MDLEETSKIAGQRTICGFLIGEGVVIDPNMI
jgi:hypothetical protein